MAKKSRVRRRKSIKRKSRVLRIKGGGDEKFFDIADKRPNDDIVRANKPIIFPSSTWHYSSLLHPTYDKTLHKQTPKSPEKKSPEKKSKSPKPRHHGRDDVLNGLFAP